MDLTKAIFTNWKTSLVGILYLALEVLSKVFPEHIEAFRSGQVLLVACLAGASRDWDKSSEESKPTKKLP